MNITETEKRQKMGIKGKRKPQGVSLRVKGVHVLTFTELSGTWAVFSHVSSTPGSVLAACYGVGGWGARMLLTVICPKPFLFACVQTIGCFTFHKHFHYEQRDCDKPCPA